MNKSPLVYLTLTKLKNQLKETLKKPARLVYIVVMAALLVMVLTLSGDDASGFYAPIEQFGAIAFALFFVMLGLTAYSGFSNGGSLFRMSDVNLLFPSPVRPQSTLFYGVAQQMGTAMLLGIFIPFQAGWMNQMYGVNFGGLLILMLCYALMILSAQVLALIIYSFTASNERARKIARAVFLVLFFAMAALILAKAYTSGAVSLSGLAFAAFEYGKFFPVAGWLAASAIAFISGNVASGLLWMAATLAFLGIAVLIFMRSTPDFYEDVMGSAQRMQTALAAQQGGVQEEVAPKNVKIGKEGLGSGAGASAFYYKHVLENRRAKSSVVNLSSLVFIIITVGYAIITRGIDESGNTVAVAAALGFGFYMQIFSSGFGRLPKELAKPFIYLVPEDSFLKLLYSLLESLPKFIVEALLMMVPFKFIFGLGVGETLMLVLLRFTWSLLFTGANLVHSRVFGFRKSKGITMMFFLLCVMIMAAPGIGAGIAAVVIIDSSIAMFAAAMAVVDIVVAGLALFIARNILNNAECNS